MTLTFLRDDRRWTGQSCLVNLSFCQAMCFYSGQTERQAGRQQHREREGGGGLHCTQESTCSALWECLDISSNSSAWEKKGKVILYALAAAGWSKKGWPQFDISKHSSHKYMNRDTLYIQTQTIILLLMFADTYTPSHAQCRSYLLTSYMYPL